jgi:hypothetical protein
MAKGKKVWNMKHIRHNCLSYKMGFTDMPEGAMLQIVHVGKHAIEIIERPTLVELAKIAHDERDFSVYVEIFQTLGNPDIAAMGIGA